MQRNEVLNKRSIVTFAVNNVINRNTDAVIRLPGLLQLSKKSQMVQYICCGKFE
jgi:hypothetical protein